jgi:hypothetical protein
MNKAMVGRLIAPFVNVDKGLIEERIRIFAGDASGTGGGDRRLDSGESAKSQASMHECSAIYGH